MPTPRSARPAGAVLNPEILTCPRCRYEFYETDDRVTLSIFDKGVDAADVQIKFEPRGVSFDSEHLLVAALILT